MDTEQILKEAEREALSCSKTQELYTLKSKYLGKEGLITKALKGMKDLPPEERRSFGQRINTLKEHLEGLFKRREEEIKELEVDKELKSQWVDLSLPQEGALGHYHPISLTLRRIKEIFLSMGFEVMEGPEIEREDYNFDMLNIPKEHPAREMQDTFYVNREGYLLRTHTSPVQIRTMLSRKPPIYMIAPGKVYRRDDDPTHSPMFHQVEGLVITHGTNFKHMKHTIHTFLRAFFETEVKVRFRSSYFPFTEPSAEVDIGCIICGGSGCRVCKGSGWLEVMGCGMVHPNVLRNCHIDPQIYQGFAFGMGVERLCMLYYRIDNIKLFYENDLRFLEQF